jgi:hypothetical protein
MAEIVFEEEFCGGHTKKTLVQLSNNYFRESIFTPHNILKEMDLQGGVLNYSGVELLRMVECLENPEAKNKKQYKSILPSKSSIVRKAQVLEHAAKDVLEIETFSTSSGEGVRFKNIPQAIHLLLVSHGLDSIAKERCVEICTAIDAAPLTKSFSSVTLGLILSDIAMKDPIIGTAICVDTIGGNCFLLCLFFILHCTLISSCT